MSIGEWQHTDVGYLEPYHVVCDLCGQLVPGRHWVQSVEGSDHVFCNPRHAELYETYWVPRYRPTGATT